MGGSVSWRWRAQLVIGNFSATTHIIEAGGIAGVVTAAVAWYTSSALTLKPAEG
jgi:succinate-acetate transporter protein